MEKSDLAEYIGRICLHPRHGTCKVAMIWPDGSVDLIQPDDSNDEMGRVPFEELKFGKTSRSRLTESIEEAKPERKKQRKKSLVSARFLMINRFVDLSMKDLTAVEVKVWVLLWRESQSGTAERAMSDISQRCGCSKMAVSKAVKKLVEKGLLEVIKKGVYGGKGSLYRVIGASF